MRTSDAAHVLGCNSRVVTRLAYALGITQPIGAGSAHIWSPGDVLSMAVFRALDSHDRYADGARQAGWALDADARPCFLVTRGGPENLVVCETDLAGQAEEILAEVLLQASDAGCAVRVVRLRPMIESLAPFVRELVNA